MDLLLLTVVVLLLVFLPQLPKSHATETDENGQAIIRLPDIFVELDILGITGSLSVVNIICSEFNVTDLELTWDVTAMEESSRLNVTVGLEEFGMDCLVDYAYDLSIGLTGSGAAIIIVSESSLDASLVFTDPGTDEEVAELVNCTAVLQVTAVKFLNQELLADFFLDFVAGTDVISDLETGFCQVLMDPDELAALLGDESIFTTIGDHTNVDPLEAEKALQIPEAVELVDLEGSETWGAAAIIKWAGKNLGKEFTRENEDGVEEEDLLINQLIGDLYKDNEDALTLNLTNVIRYEGVNILGTAMVLELDQVSVAGLDTFSTFDNFQVLGNHTLQVDVTIELVQLSVSGDLTLVDERVNVDFSLPNVNATIALLFAVDEVALGGILMSAFLEANTEVAFNCLLASVLNVEVADSVMYSLRIQEHDSLSLQSIHAMGIPFGAGNLVADILPNLFEPSNETSTCESLCPAF